jgi:hypothetical protein
MWDKGPALHALNLTNYLTTLNLLRRHMQYMNSILYFTRTHTYAEHLTRGNCFKQCTHFLQGMAGPSGGAGGGGRPGSARPPMSSLPGQHPFDLPPAQVWFRMSHKFNMRVFILHINVNHPRLLWIWSSGSELCQWACLLFPPPSPSSTPSATLALQSLPINMGQVLCNLKGFKCIPILMA